MDFTVICTYRCNSRCSMCYVWQNPSHPQEEIGLDVLEKIPSGIDNLNITGGEPTLRADLLEMVDILYPKARKLEISSNGLMPEKLEGIVKKYPDIKIRFSLDGLGRTNDLIRGEQGGFDTKLNGLKRLKELGGCDLGFAVTVQDDNAHDLLEVYRLTTEMGIELATSTLHNGYQFHKNDNALYDRLHVARALEGLIEEMLKTNSVKNWFRAYLNLGLVERALGHPRLIPCTAAGDFVFLDPWGDVYACNVRPDLKLGNLVEQDWSSIFEGSQAQRVRGMVAACKQNCWMVGSARTAMRNPRLTSLPKLEPLMWVISQKLRVSMGLPIPFDRWVDHQLVDRSTEVDLRATFLDSHPVKPKLQRKQDSHYDLPGGFFNK